MQGYQQYIQNLDRRFVLLAMITLNPLRVTRTGYTPGIGGGGRPACLSEQPLPLLLWGAQALVFGDHAVPPMLQLPQLLVQ